MTEPANDAAAAPSPAGEPSVPTRLEGCRPCPVCGATRARFVFEAGAEKLGKHDRVPTRRYPYFRCLECDAVFIGLLPPDEDLRVYFESDNYHFRADRASNRLSRGRDLQMALGRPLPSDKPGRLLDFGCGHGDYLAFAEGRGWTVTGVEYNEASASVARQRGFRVVLESELDGLPDQSFDAISLLHSLEHVVEPRTILQRLVPKLAPDGRFLIELPYLDCHEFRIFGEDYCLVIAPSHLQFFSDRTMDRLAADCGLAVVSRRNNIWTPTHYVWSILNRFERRTGRIVGRQRKMMLSAAGFPFVLPIAALTSALGAKGNTRQYVLSRKA